MDAQARILIADDEPTFLNAIADLLRREGFECDCAPDAAVALAMIGNCRYDLLIADIKMPGNTELEFIGGLARSVPDLPVILITAYPSVQTAVQAIGLTVAAYLIKPVDFPELLAHVRSAVRTGQVYRAMAGTESRLRAMTDQLAAMQQVSRIGPGRQAQAYYKSFVSLTVQNILASLEDLEYLSSGTMSRLAGEPLVGLSDAASYQETLRVALSDAIQVLDKTKDAFKSKELGKLRRRLEEVLKSSSTEVRD